MEEVNSTTTNSSSKLFDGTPVNRDSDSSNTRTDKQIYNIDFLCQFDKIYLNSEMLSTLYSYHLKQMKKAEARDLAKASRSLNQE